MAAPTTHPFPLWLQYVINHRLAFIGVSSAAAIIGVSALAAKMHQDSKKYSRTAEIACMLRALSRKESDPRYRTRDNLAEYFLPFHLRLLVNYFPWAARWRVSNTVPAGLSWVIARTHIYDHLMESMLQSERNITQVVILGAGLDTRFHRLHIPKDRQIQLFEVDHLWTSLHKRETLAAVPHHAFEIGGQPRPDINYVAVNFERQTLESTLARQPHYDRNAKTFFLWEAVTPYLNDQAVAEVLDFVKRLSGPGSILAFDVRFKEAITGTKQYRMSKLTSTVGKLNEPFKFGVPEGTSRQWITSQGFDLHALFEPHNLSEYVTSDVSYSLDVPDIMDIIVARTKPQATEN